MAAAVAVLAAVAVAWWALAAGSLIDTAVFRSVAHAVLAGRSPYGVTTVVPFVYPPAGVLVTLPAAIGPNLRVAALVGVSLSLAALARTTWLLAVLAWPALDRGRLWQRTCWMFAGACLLQPTLITLSFGQVGLVLMWLTVEGLKGQPDSTRRTWLVGAAAAAKLTAAVVLVGLVAAGRWRAAVWGIVGLVATTVVAAAVTPVGVRDYVHGAWRWAQDVNATRDLLNHSLIGVTRLVGAPTWVGLVAAGLALLVGIAISALLWRRGDELAGLATVLITGLLASPVSWGHHWVAVYPALALLLRELRVRRATAVVLLSTGIAGMLLWVDEIAMPDSRVLQLDDVGQLVQREWYLVWAVAFLGWTAVALVRRPREQSAVRPGIAAGSPQTMLSS